jgi:hypothetical protein
VMPSTTRAVFLSYRREETRHIAGRLADRLTERLGSTQVFIDVDTIDPGADFAAAIAREVASCEVLIALIGPTWSTIADQQGQRRLDDPDDFVVLEIQAALQREIRVIPVLVDGAVMPNRYDLPESLQDLARRNAVRLDHATFRSDVATLLDAVQRALSTPVKKAVEPTVKTGARTVDETIDTERSDRVYEANNLGIKLAAGVLILALIGGSTAGVMKYLSSRFPNAAEQALLGQVPLALTMKDSCTRNDEAEQDTANVQASVICTADGDANTVVFTKFTSAKALDSHYQAAVAAAGIGMSSGDCLNAERAEGVYASESGVASGRVLCYQQRGSSFIEWTDEGYKTLGVATRIDPDYVMLRGWWAGVVGEKHPR